MHVNVWAHFMVPPNFAHGCTSSIFNQKQPRGQNRHIVKIWPYMPYSIYVEAYPAFIDFIGIFSQNSILLPNESYILERHRMDSCLCGGFWEKLADVLLSIYFGQFCHFCWRFSRVKSLKGLVLSQPCNICWAKDLFKQSKKPPARKDGTFFQWFAIKVG